MPAVVLGYAYGGAEHCPTCTRDTLGEPADARDEEGEPLAELVASDDHDGATCDDCGAPLVAAAAYWLRVEPGAAEAFSFAIDAVTLAEAQREARIWVDGARGPRGRVTVHTADPRETSTSPVYVARRAKG